MSSRESKRPQHIVQRVQYPENKHPQLFKHLEIGSAHYSELIKFNERATDDATNTNADPQTHISNNFSDVLKKAEELVLHPAFVQLGMDYATETISGTSARCIAFVAALVAYFGEDFTRPNNDQLLSTYLIGYVNNVVRYLSDCRTTPLALDNIIVRCQDIIAQSCRLSSQAETDVEDDMMNTIRIISRGIQQYLKELQQQHQDTILVAQKHIKDGDVILTYGLSDTVVNALLSSREIGTVVKVIVVDSRPLLEGKKLLHTLTQHGFECDYALITSLQFIMPNVTKVLLGATAILSNGALLSRSGSTLVALTAKRCNKPVLVCAESFKFVHHVFLDGICQNELAKPNYVLLSKEEQHLQLESTFSSLPNGINKIKDPDADEKAQMLHKITTMDADIIQQTAGNSHANSASMMNEKALTTENWGEMPNLKLLHLRFDITPPNYISALITNYDTLPPSSASVVGREEGKKKIIIK